MLQQIGEWRLDQGLKNVPPVSEALRAIYRSSHLFKNSTKLERLNVYQAICQISPDIPTFRLNVLKAQFLAKPFDIYHLFKGIKALWEAVKTDLGWGVARGGQLIIVFISALILTAFFVALIFIAKYKSYLIFYMRRFVRFSMNTLLAALLILIIFLLPVYFDIGLAWLPFFCMVLMWMLFTKKEKVVVLLLLVSFLGVSFGFSYVSRFLVAAAHKKSYLVYLANYELLDASGIRELKRMKEARKDDPEVLFTLGLLAKRRGDYETARRFYLQALKLKPNFSECMNNLGNVYLLMKGTLPNATTLARKWYKKAIKVNPARAEYYYNLSKSFPLLHVEGMEYIVKARDLNPLLIDELTRRDSKHPNRMLADCLLSPLVIWHRALAPGTLPKDLYALFNVFFLNEPFRNNFIMPGILIFLIIVFSILQRRFALATPCLRCGQLFFKSIPIHYSQGLCHQCQMIQQRVSQTDPELVKQKEKEIANYRKREKLISFLMGIFPAGGIFFYEDQTFIGLVVSYLFFFFLSAYFVFGQFSHLLSQWFFGYSFGGHLFLVLALLTYAGGFTQMILIFARDRG